jgi:hypothetical protein
MARKPKEIKRLQGRPEAEIDWALVDEYLKAGCTGTEIAGVLGVCPETLYTKCQSTHNLVFSVYSQQKKQGGDGVLRKAQYDKAISGDNTLLIWLGKVRLEQRETQQIAVSAETSKNFESVMNQLEELQQNGHNPSSMNSPEE